MIYNTKKYDFIMSKSASIFSKLVYNQYKKKNARRSFKYSLAKISIYESYEYITPNLQYYYKETDRFQRYYQVYQ